MSASMNWMPWKLEMAWPNWWDLRVLHRVLVRALGDTQRQRADRDAAAGERAHERLEAAGRLAQHLVRGHETVLEHHLHRVRAAQAHLLLLLADAEAGRGRVHDERRDAVRA